MFNISKLVNRITDRGTGREDTGESSASFVESEDHHSAEGFLCPPCMKAFPSAEDLEAHYNSTHLNNEGTQSPSDSLSSTNGDVQTLRQEILSLQSCLAEERNMAEELKKEVQKIQAGLVSKDEDDSSLKSQEKDFESTKSLLTSEVTLLRKQLTDSLDKLSQAKKDKEHLGEKILELSNEKGAMKSAITSLQSQLCHRNSIDDTAVLKQELVSVQRMMDQLALEKEKEIEKLSNKIEGLETALQNSTASSASNEIDRQKLKESAERIQLIEKQLEEAKQENEKIANNHVNEMNNWTTETEQLREKFNDSDQKKMSFEVECKELKEEVKRLQEQHAELYSKIEGGEGAKAALEALQKENSTLSENLESATEKQLELSKNLYNTTKQLEKSQSEIKKLTEAYEAESEERKAKELFLTDQLSTKETQTKIAIQRLEESTKLVNNYEKEITSLKSAVEDTSQQLSKVNEERDTLVSAKSNLNTELENLRREKLDKEDQLEKLQAALQDAKAHNDDKESKIQSLQVKVDEFVAEKLDTENKLKEIEDEKSRLLEKISVGEKETVKFQQIIQIKKKEVDDRDAALKKSQEEYHNLQNESANLTEKLEEKVGELQTSLHALQELRKDNEKLKGQIINFQRTSAEALQNLSSQIESLQNKLKSEVEAVRSRTEELESVRSSSKKALSDIKTELENVRADKNEKATQLESLQKDVQKMKAQFDERESKLQILQLQTDEAVGEKMELEKKVKSSEEEKSILLERCLSGESEAEDSRQAIKTMQRKSEDSLAALQEFARENQSLQVEIAKLQGRKWADDSLVTNCTTCDKDFTLTIRKHHCRHCGQIFCNDCSSRTASVPSCKKPARVCDSCYQELLMKGATSSYVLSS